MEQSAKNYLASLQQLIAQTREDAGYNLNWCIAQVSYAWSNYNNTKKMESMKRPRVRPATMKLFLWDQRPMIYRVSIDTRIIFI